MIVAGVMSGTSADGIDVALVRITSGRDSNRVKLLGHVRGTYSASVRNAVLSAMNSTHVSVPDLARLNFLLAELYAEAILHAQQRFRVNAELIGCHGQTLYHQGESAHFLGRNIAATWQTGEGSVIAGRVGVPVVSDFRPADIAAGGKGAPLVPFLDYMLFRDPRAGRIAQNIGGIANLTAIPAGASPEEVIAFDTGPGNMVIDALATKFFGKAYDRNGSIAAAGRVIERVVNNILRDAFFRRRPPKTAGREQFGREFVAGFVRRCGRAGKEDIIATATALTAHSIADALRKFVLNRGAAYRDFIVSGGGSKNRTLMRMLAVQLQPLGLHLRTSDEFGIPSQAKEAAAFALLAYETWYRRPSNLPSATGATRPAILGKVSYA